MKMVQQSELMASLSQFRFKRLYQFLDETTLSADLGTEGHFKFACQARGEFIQISRLRANLSMESVAAYLKIPPESMESFENGKVHLPNRQFFLLAAYLKSGDQVSIFLRKLENAMNPSHREARNAMAKFCAIYGFRTFGSDGQGGSPS